ncbi:MAG: phosphoenolpyruvate--protein phosphotransferase, partial [Clostridiales Family XIII bacterium]|nr:phosphoenolpyruvate--protein phosphotransferase [Clostridiales Family XIII bacterium]
MQNGIAVSPGIEIGTAFVFQAPEITVNTGKISPSRVEEESLGLSDAIEKTKAQIEAIRDRTKEEMGEENAEIFEAHLMILEDFLFKDSIDNLIRVEYISAEYATQ